MEHIVKTSDIAEESIANLAAESALVTIEDEFIVLHGFYDYDIWLGACKTPEQMLRWINHLSGKTWFTIPMLRAFILAVSEKIKFYPYL